MNLPPFDRDAARDLLKEKADKPFSAYDVGGCAHWRVGRQQHAEAALLFCLAAERADAEHRADPSKPNQAMNDLVRAGVEFNCLGKTDISESLFRQAIAFDWVGQGLPHDQHMVEWAFHYLLLNVRQDPARFTLLFDEAVSCCAALGRDFPGIRPFQEELLDIAIGVGNRQTVERLASKIADRRPGKKPAKDLLRRARIFLSGST